ncbi:ACP S-malonyltransferase [Hazenella coriacea]|uniref:[acyl-carrier-protein] S-malonyltransferase n=1 Tax=Hazenella coriacea TaxID=1179467 RepID=A0A4R3L640_9BACL|nr:ACP S-malonyltransferase [Hazenella coriacea]TCS93654.1 trans-AT polyketide synthase/acyltransferase/oxidoreductase domain-containing protein [Hazenella coriacea]
MITYVFPGQGSQRKGMGSTLFDEFKELTVQADEILGYSIKRLCIEDPHSYLSQTQFTQPALYVVNAFSYLKRIQELGRKPDFVAGHSLGEYNALFAAGAFDFETGLRLVKKRGELMSAVTGGGMAAVIGLNEEQVAEVLQENRLDTIDVANFNAPDQIVISGRKADIDQAKPIFEALQEVRLFIPLNVSGAFHSRYMSAVKLEFEQFINGFQFNSLSIPVISNVYARPYEQEKINTTLTEQINKAVQWSESIRFLMGRGEMKFEEIGPGMVLTGLIQRIKKEATPLVIDTEEINEELDQGRNCHPLVMTSPVEATTSDKNFPVHQTQILVEPEIEHMSSHSIHSSFLSSEITASSLGSSEFKSDYNLKYAYLTGGMYRGIASPEMVVKMAKSGMMGFFGAGGLSLQQIEAGIRYIQTEISSGQAYGINLVHHMKNAEIENKTIDLLLKYEVRNLEAAAFLSVTPALVRFHAKGLKRDLSGKVINIHRIIAKVSRPEVAEAFLSPAPEYIIQNLLSENKITPEEAELSREIPMADDICVEADSAGHTDGGIAYTLMPAITKLRDEMMEKYQYQKKVRVGAAGGIGTPEAAMAAFLLDADFILTGSINQCTVEAATSDKVKDLLQQMNVQDTEYAPAGDTFEMGSKIQVLRKGVFFPGRANKLYELYRRYNSLNEIDEKTLTQIQEKYFRRSIEKVYEDIKSYYPAQEIEKAEQNPKHKMALIFKWYFRYSSQLALSGSGESTVDYQVHCGPALGAFNQWVKGTELESWRNRYVDEIGTKLMIETAKLLNDKIRSLLFQAT